MPHHKQPWWILYNKILRDSKHLIQLHFHSHGVCILMSSLKLQYLTSHIRFACLKKENYRKLHAWVNLFSKQVCWDWSYFTCEPPAVFEGFGSHSIQGDFICTGMLLSSVRLTMSRWRWFICSFVIVRGWVRVLQSSMNPENLRDSRSLHICRLNHMWWVILCVSLTGPLHPDSFGQIFF